MRDSLLTGGHRQTILGHLLRIEREIPGGKKFAIRLEDGDQLSGLFYQGKNPVTVVLLHGLAGSIDSGYIRRTARLFLAEGNSVVLVNHRGCGFGKELQFKKPYHSGRAEDLAASIAYARGLLPKNKLLAIGFSLSGNALLLLAGKFPQLEQPDVLIAVNPPIVLEKASLRLGRGLNRIYDQVFLRRCLREIQLRVDRGWLPADPKYAGIKSIYELDEQYTGIQSGFTGREDYYRQCSAKSYISKIRQPARILTAKDDPFVDCADFLELELPTNIGLEIVPVGGHMGYLRVRLGLNPVEHWFDAKINEWAMELLSRIPYTTASAIS